MPSRSPLQAFHLGELSAPLGPGATAGGFFEKAAAAPGPGLGAVEALQLRTVPGTVDASAWCPWPRATFGMELEKL